MLRLENRSAPQVRPSSRAADRLAVAWLHGELAVTEFGDGGTRTVWTSPKPVVHVRDLGPTLRAAIEALGGSARSISMVLAHDDLVQCRTEMPRMRASERQRFLQRQVEQAPSPAPPLHWASRPAVAAGTPDAALLLLMPRALHDAIVSACTENGLTLRLLIPFAELLGHCRPGAEDSGEGFLLLVSNVGRSTELLVMHSDGTPVVARTGTSDPTTGNVRLMGEILRTLQFVQQTFETPVARICWLGSDSMPAGASGNAAIQTISRWVPEAGTAEYWAGRLASLTDFQAINLLALEQRQASSRRWVTRMHRTLATLSLVAAAGFLAYAERVRTQEQFTIRRLKDQLGPLEIREQNLRQRAQAHASQRALIQLADESPGVRAPLCILGQIGIQLPPDLRLTNVQIVARHNGWDLRVSGQTRTSVHSLQDSLNDFSSFLSGSPLFVRWSHATNAGPASGTHDGWKTRWVETLATSSQRKGPAGFMLEGRIP